MVNQYFVHILSLVTLESAERRNYFLFNLQEVSELMAPGSADGLTTDCFLGRGYKRFFNCLKFGVENGCNLLHQILNGPIDQFENTVLVSCIFVIFNLCDREIQL